MARYFFPTACQWRRNVAPSCAYSHLLKRLSVRLLAQPLEEPTNRLRLAFRAYKYLSAVLRRSNISPYPSGNALARLFLGLKKRRACLGLGTVFR